MGENSTSIKSIHYHGSVLFIFHRYQTQMKKKLYHDFVIISLIYPPQLL